MPTNLPTDKPQHSLHSQPRETLLTFQIVVIAFILLGMLISLNVGAIPTEFPDIPFAP